MEAYKKLTPVTGDMSVPVHDLCLLEDVNTASLLHTLRQRYAVDDIYTAIGPIAVAVNPYKKVASCSAENFANMKDLDEESIPPHVFRVGLSAYMAMMRTGSAQSVLISGESGAGKTETAKLTMNVLAEVSQSSGKTTEQCLEAGIVLEAFGNAKTVYNNNSSRFGKWCAVHFQKGQIATCKIRSYLLEKTRVVTVNEGERNYHVFYHMLAGCTAEEKATYLLAGTNDAYNYTKGQATSDGHRRCRGGGAGPHAKRSREVSVYPDTRATRQVHAKLEVLVRARTRRSTRASGRREGRGEDRRSETW